MRFLTKETMQSTVFRWAQLCGAVLSIMVVGGGMSFAQSENSRSVFYSQTWFTYTGNHHIADSRFALDVEITDRVSDFDSGAHQFQTRFGLLYDITKSRSIRAGGGYVFSRVAAGSRAGGLIVPEHRSWEQLALRHHTEQVAFTHKLRVEQRWVGTNTDLEGENRIHDYTYRNRFRYAMRAVLPLNWQSESKFYTAIQNEVMLNFGKNVVNTFDQNRLSVVLGYRTGQVGSLEAGYQLQTVSANSAPPQNRHVLLINFRSDQDLKW